MPLKMRNAEIKDIGALCILMDEMSHTKISENDMLNRLQLVGKSQIDSLFVCENNKELVGLLGFRIRENLEEKSRFGEISAIVVNHDKKRQGVGRFMMDYAEKLANEYKCKGMWLVSGFSREEEAHQFYRQLGFEATGYRFVKLFKP
jgi:N-acetylglutamate synthase-like GNAT family acetyltransferase